MNENMNENYNPYTTPPEGKRPNPSNEGPVFAHIPHPPKQGNGFELAALLLGFLAVISCTCIYVSVIFGALSILFALLSRGGKMKMSSKAKLGMILGIAGIVLTVVFTAYSFYIALAEYGTIENMLREYCEMAGLDFEELYGDMFQ